MHFMKSAKKSAVKVAVARKKAAVKKKAAVARPKIAAVVAARGDAPAAPHPALREEHTIEARNFGPIAEAKLTLKPLTVLIGPSNTGKTYMAMLACMMMKKHAEFVENTRDRMLREPLFYNRREASSNRKVFAGAMSAAELRAAVAQLLSIVKQGERFIPLSALPDKLQDLLRHFVEEQFGGAIGRSVKSKVWRAAESDFGEYYGVGNALDLVAGNRRDDFRCEYRGRIGDSETMSARFAWSKKTGMSARAKLSDFCFPILPSRTSSRLAEMQRELNPSYLNTLPRRAIATERLLFNLLGISDVTPTVHFLPASRGGVTQAERVMGIAMMRIGGRAGWSDIPPTLSRTVVDYLVDLRRFLDTVHRMQEEQAAISRHSSAAREASVSRFQTPARASRPEIIRVIEEIENLIGGQIVAKSYGSNGASSSMPSSSNLGVPSERRGCHAGHGASVLHGRRNRPSGRVYERGELNRATRSLLRSRRRIFTPPRRRRWRKFWPR